MVSGEYNHQPYEAPEPPETTSKCSATKDDDIVAVISGDNRRELEQRTATVSALLEEWTETQKLEISAQKTVYMIFKNKLGQNPTIRIKEQSVTRLLEEEFALAKICGTAEADFMGQQICREEYPRP
ncbi:hypothetical protein ILUMI_10781 [Ignelater luminosus]|uniref:Uncharacterized protein n=1 Tax=Ignelater luminosus TaxID=2038154 RepID=A0A8K0GDB0_IGNLU|nr:hypothetical protein ILUMI_10781 [Ignelater luminosus]